MSASPVVRGTQFTAKIETSQVPSHDPPTYGTTYTQVADLHGLLMVDDAVIRSRFPEFDGYERPFALLPFRTPDGGLTWSRQDLVYRGAGLTGYIQLRPVDAYELPRTRIDESAVREHGVALGLETNVSLNRGTLYAQAPDKNARPNAAGSIAHGNF